MLGFKVNEIGRYIVVFVWVLINIVLFTTTYVEYATTKKFTYLRVFIKKGLPIARGAAMVLNFNCMLILLTMCRNIISLIRSHCHCTIMRPVIRVLDKSVTFHKYIAYTICLMTIIHVGAHCFNFENLVMSWETEAKINQKLSQSNEMVNPVRKKNADPVTEMFKSIPGWSGAVITLCLIVMVSSSTELIRRSYFEVFWYSHHLFILFFFGMLVHGIGRVLRFQTNLDSHDPEYCQDHLENWGKENTKCSAQPTFDSNGASSWKFIIVPLVLYFLERCLRFYRSLQGVQIVKVVKHPSNVVEIHMKKSGFLCEAGQYIFIQCSKISQLEWHPFTLTSAPEEEFFSVHIRLVGDWTSALSKELGADKDQLRDVSQLPRIAVDGPYGTASTDVFKYNVVMCIGAGIGVTPFASILKSIWWRRQYSPDTLCVQKVYFYWICRESFSFEWFSDLLKRLEVQMAESNHYDFIQINIFLTKWDTKMAKRIALEEPTAERDPITGLFSRTEYGRPGWNDIFKSVADAHNNTNIGVFFCGPSGLSHDLHKMCDQSNDESKGVKFFYNKENF